MLETLSLILALAAAASFYASVPHQGLFPAWPERKAALRTAGCILCALAVATASVPLGFWPGFFAALTMLMLGCVVLPYVAAWRAHRRQADVG